MKTEFITRALAAMTPKVTKGGHTLVVPSQGRWQDRVAQGNMYGGSVDASGVAPGTSIGTGAGFALYNPHTSKKALSICKVTMGYLSGTLGGGVIMYCVNIDPAAAAVTGTPIVVNNMLVGSDRADGGNSGQLFDAATLPASPSLVRPFCSLGASLASSVVAPWKIEDEPDSEFILLPGTTLSMEGIAADGTSPLVIYGIVWEEILVASI